MTPREVYEEYRQQPGQDMYDYAPHLRQVAHGVVLEIGVRYGVSTSAFLLGLEEHGGHLYSVDIDNECRKLFLGHPQWTFIHADSRDAGVVKSHLDGQQVDVLFIDGDHSYAAVKSDLANYAALVRSGGLILMHDVDPQVPAEMIRLWGWEKDEPRRAFDEFVQETGYAAKVMPGLFGLGVIEKSKLS